MPNLLHTPASLSDLDDTGHQAWNDQVVAICEPYFTEHPQFLDPLSEQMTGATAAPVTWPAFPARLLLGVTTDEQRWRRADSKRSEQDEYCEWAVQRDPDGVITQITFTTEVPEYWKLIAQHDPEKLLKLYRDLVDPVCTEPELFRDGVYVPGNVRNRSTEGRPAHMIQTTNTLGAAVDLMARATVLRERADGRPIVDQQSLVTCSKLGDPFRHSDPQIAAAINNQAATGAQVSFQDPVGLYIDRIITTGMACPDGADPAEFWKVERGDAERAVRASYSVPASHGYRVGDITLAGRPITFGAQLADRVHVRVTALTKPAGFTPQRFPCIA